MNKIEVSILDEPQPIGESMLALGRLTQRGHKLEDMSDLRALFDKAKSDAHNPEYASVIKNMATMPHGTIKRFSPITIGIVGASRRFLMQARTHQVGMTYVSASLQYSNYSGADRFVVPYELMQKDYENNTTGINDFGYVNNFISSCSWAMEAYREMVNNGLDNDTAGYVAPHALRNIIVMQGNHQSWQHFIRMRTCNRNTNETQYVALLIWKELLKTQYGRAFFTGPDCLNDGCHEGTMSCGNPLYMQDPMAIIHFNWPLLRRD